MRYITLVCAAGMSTSILVSKMQQSAKKLGIEAKIIAMAEEKFQEYSEPTEVLLLGPQIAYMEDEMRAEYEPKGIKVSVINMMDYGTMNGENVLKYALSLLD